MQNDFSLIESHRKLAVANLKRCPVCDTVNAKLNAECFVCRWHGEFDHDPHSVERGLIDVVEQCPELLDCILYVPRRTDTLVSRAMDWLRIRRRKPIDLEL